MFKRSLFCLLVVGGMTACDSDTKVTKGIEIEGTEIAQNEQCDLEAVNLLDFEPWKREEGWWVGEYKERDCIDWKSESTPNYDQLHG